MPRLKQTDTSRASLVRLAVKLRFGPRPRYGASLPLMSLKEIAGILKVSLPTVQGYLKSDALNLLGPLPKIRGRHPPLTAEQRGWLISEDKLSQMAHLTLAQRAVMFHRRWPERKVSPSTICKLYKVNKIKRKAVPQNPKTPIL